MKQHHRLKTVSSKNYQGKNSVDSETMTPQKGLVKNYTRYLLFKCIFLVKMDTFKINIYIAVFEVVVWLCVTFWRQKMQNSMFCAYFFTIFQFTSDLHGKVNKKTKHILNLVGSEIFPKACDGIKCIFCNITVHETLAIVWNINSRQHNVPFVTIICKSIFSK